MRQLEESRRKELHELQSSFEKKYLRFKEY
jgi:hypothetical protein